MAAAGARGDSAGGGELVVKCWGDNGSGQLGRATAPAAHSSEGSAPSTPHTRPIASSVSFCMMPKMRSGRACISEAGSMPISMPMKPNSRPQAPSENATE